MDQKRKRLRELPLNDRLVILGGASPATPEELKARREWGKRVDALAKKIGTIDISVEDLLHLSDEELEAKYGREPADAAGP